MLCSSYQPYNRKTAFSIAVPDVRSTRILLFKSFVSKDLGKTSLFFRLCDQGSDFRLLLEVLHKSALTCFIHV